MYFRFPLILLLVFVIIVGVLALKGHLASQAPERVQSASLELTGSSGEGNADRVPLLQAGRASLSPDDLQAHVEFLADDLLEGRDAASRGARIASLYIASHFERNGLKPVGDAGTYYQNFKLRRKQYLPQSSVAIEVDGEMVPLEYETDFLISGSPDRSDEVVELEMVFAGFGIKADEFDYNDFADIDYQEKATIAISGEPASEDEDFFDGDRNTRYADGRLKRRVALELGAGGYISLMTYETLDNFSWQALKNYLARPNVSLPGFGGRFGPDGAPTILLHPRVGDLLFAGTSRTFEEIAKAANEGRAQPFEMKKKIRFNLRFSDDLLDDRNVVGLVEGSDAELKSEIVVFTAHYDHVGIGVPVDGDSIYNGAADNASGVAGILELAEAYSSLEKKPRRSLLFLAVSAEEKGLLGSKYYVEKPLFDLSETVANFNLDMIGILDTTGVVLYGQERSSLGAIAAAQAQKLGLEVIPDELPEQRIFYRSDHYSFARKGVPAIFPSFGIRRKDYPTLREFYHRPSDDPDVGFNYRYMKKMVDLVYLTATEVANADAHPTWSEGDEFGKIRSSEGE